MQEAGQSLYTEIGGFDKVLELCRIWTKFCLANPAAAHPFEHCMHPNHDVRLAAYLAEAFGGPAIYSAGYGDESAVQRIHAGNGAHLDIDEACLFEFDRALAEVGVAGPAAEAASAYFRRATEEQRAYAAPDSVVPDGLPFNYSSSSEKSNS